MGRKRQHRFHGDPMSDEKLGRDELIEAIEGYYRAQGVTFERVVFPFRGPKNVGIVSESPVVQPGRRHEHKKTIAD